MGADEENLHRNCFLRDSFFSSFFWWGVSKKATLPATQCWFTESRKGRRLSALRESETLGRRTFFAFSPHFSNYMRLLLSKTVTGSGAEKAKDDAVEPSPASTPYLKSNSSSKKKKSAKLPEETSAQDKDV